MKTTIILLSTLLVGCQTMPQQSPEFWADWYARQQQSTNQLYQGQMRMYQGRIQNRAIRTDCYYLGSSLSCTSQ